jgi:hypothetical protein
MAGKKVKKVRIDSITRLQKVVAATTEQTDKTNVMLRVDARLLADAQAKFGRRMSAIFEAALQDALELKKGEGKKSS